MTHDGSGQKAMKMTQNIIHLDGEIRSNWARHINRVDVGCVG